MQNSLVIRDFLICTLALLNQMHPMPSHLLIVDSLS